MHLGGVILIDVHSLGFELLDDLKHPISNAVVE
jgi:hypothetical protein